MTQGDGKGRCDMLSEKGRSALDKYEQRMAEIAEKQLELIDLENVRQMLCDALERTERLLARGADASGQDRARLKERLSSLPTEIALAEQCIDMLRQIIEKTHFIADLERRDSDLD